MQKNKKIIMISLLSFLLIVGISFYFTNKTPNLVETEGQTWTGKKESNKDSETEMIAIPGFESLSLEKNQSKQSVNFYNPEKNNCYFKLTLLLPDGTVIWKSKYIEPGNGIYEIDLDNPLEEGEYENAVLKYQCYTLNDEQTPLNGSEIKFKLFVL